MRPVSIPAIQPFRSYHCDMRSGEVLSRWVHGECIVTPNELNEHIDWATIDYNNIVKLGMASPLLRAHFDSLFVNLDPRTLKNRKLLDGWILAAQGLKERSGIEVVVEITECATFGDYEQAIHTLRSEGMLIALDDFGEAESTLTRLYKHEWDYCKYNATTLSNPDVIEAIHSCRERNIVTVVERVETVDQTARAQLLGIDLEQGYLSSRPQLLGRFLSSQRGRST